mmetsp:Transcript_56800/g.151577  ORF Transcript_56800/g.151577 Transcript_56800/m.151577 type:complete len:758 (-) Transcript_56800:962-3235(-)
MKREGDQQASTGDAKRAKTADQTGASSQDGCDKSKAEVYQQQNEQKHCLAFDGFYAAQEIVPPEEWDTFFMKMQEPLPVSFRLVQTAASHEVLKARVEEIMASPDVGGKLVSFPWYPGGGAYQLNCNKTEMRQNVKLRSFHEWLVKQSESCTVVRQELVSMIPALFANVEQHHMVLDLCAAPGSKTSQLLELLVGQRSKMGGTDPCPAGVVVANDLSAKRGYMLVSRLHHHATSCLAVTNHDSTVFPAIHLPDADGKYQRLAFDRILADVPCCGDGTLRKQPHGWRTWHAQMGVQLHPTQLRILRRAVSLLKVGGTLVYSTCSLNPLENEAVVAAVIAAAGGALKIVDASDRIPELKRRPGLTTWKVPSKKGEYFASAEEAAQVKTGVRPSMFPPGNILELGLERSMRFFPQDNNSGAFFVCVIEKLSAVPWENFGTVDASGELLEREVREVQEEDLPVPEPEPNSQSIAAKAKAKFPPKKEKKHRDPADFPTTPAPEETICGNVALKAQADYVDLTSQNEGPDIVSSMAAKYGINAAPGILATRGGEQPRKIMFASAGVARLLKCRSVHALKVLHAGSPAIEKMSGGGGSQYRLCSAGLRWTVPTGATAPCLIQLDLGSMAKVLSAACETRKTGWLKASEWAPALAGAPPGLVLLRCAAPAGGAFTVPAYKGISNLEIHLEQGQLDGIRHNVVAQAPAEAAEQANAIWATAKRAAEAEAAAAEATAWGVTPLAPRTAPPSWQTLQKAASLFQVSRG